MFDIIETIKKAALGAVEESGPVGVFFGTVTSTSPLKIRVEQKMTLEKPQLVLTSTVIKTPLVIGNKVILLRVQGGQKFIVLDTTGV